MLFTIQYLWITSSQNPQFPQVLLAIFWPKNANYSWTIFLSSKSTQEFQNIKKQNRASTMDCIFY